MSEKEKRAKQTIDRSIDRTSSTTKDEDNLSLSLSLSVILPKRDTRTFGISSSYKKRRITTRRREFWWTFFLGARKTRAHKTRVNIIIFLTLSER